MLSGIANARSLRLGDKGTVFVSNRNLDKVYAIVDKNGKREAKVIASGLDRPNGLAFNNGTLYIAEGTKISKLEKIEDNLDNPPKPVVIYSDFAEPSVARLEVHGASAPTTSSMSTSARPATSASRPPPMRQIRRINLDGSGAEPYARGVRNSVGFDWHPVTKELYFTDNGRDWLSEDLPEDELNRVTKIGQHFGFPYCHQGDLTDREFGWGRSLRRVREAGRQARPALGRARHALLHRHHVPAEYRGAIFIARHGSWNKTKKIGGDVVFVTLNKDGTREVVEPFLTGFLQNNELYRPPGRRAGHEGRLAAGLRRLRGRGLPHQLRRAPHRGAIGRAVDRSTDDCA